MKELSEAVMVVIYIYCDLFCWQVQAEMTEVFQEQTALTEINIYQKNYQIFTRLVIRFFLSFPANKNVLRIFF